MGVPVGAPVRPEGPPGQDAAAGAGGRGPAPRAAGDGGGGTRGAGTRSSLPSPGRSLWKVAAPSRSVSPGPRRRRGARRRASSRGRERRVPHLSAPPLAAPAHPARPGPERAAPRGQSAGPPGAAASSHLWRRGPWTHLGGGRGGDRGRCSAWAAPGRSGAVPAAPGQRHGVSRPAAAPSALILPDPAPPPPPGPRPSAGLPREGAAGRSRRPRDPSARARAAGAGRAPPADWLLG